MHMRLFLIVILIGTLRYSFAQEKAWVQVSQQMVRSDSFFDSDSNPVTIRTNAVYLTTFSGELPIGNRAIAHFTMPLFARATVNGVQFNQSGNTQEGASLSSLGDAEAFVRVLLRKKLPVKVEALLGIGIPFGKQQSVGSETGLQTGDGEFNQFVGVQVMQTAGAFNLAGYVIVNNRSRDFSNEIRYGFSATYQSKKYKAIMRFSAIESLFNDTAPVALNGIFSNHREIFSPGVEVHYHISKRLAAVASTDFAVAGRNTLNAPLLSLGVRLTGK